MSLSNVLWDYRGLVRSIAHTWCVMLPTFLICVLASACVPEASLLLESPSGGLVAYPIKNDNDVLAAAGRGEAVRLIEKKCQNGSTIVREGEIPRVSRNADRAWQGQLSGDRLWGVQFTCK